MLLFHPPTHHDLPPRSFLFLLFWKGDAGDWISLHADDL